MASKKITWAIILIVLFLGSGCAHRIYVQSSLPQGTPVYFYHGDSCYINVASGRAQDPDLIRDVGSDIASLLEEKGYQIINQENSKYIVRDPLYPNFKKEIGNKVAVLLRGIGFRISNQENADYVISVLYSIIERQTKEWVPPQTDYEYKYFKDKNGKEREVKIKVEKPGYYENYYIYTRKVVVDVVNSKKAKAAKAPSLIWTGFSEDQLKTQYLEKYEDHMRLFSRMLLAVFVQLGKGSDKLVCIAIERDNPLLEQLYRAK